MTSSDRAPATTAVVVWLFVCAFMVFAMIIVGGLTRLTQSGLSMVEWQPVSGVIPPLSLEAWQLEFDLYKQSPEYLLVNEGMSIAEFKKIFWMEYAHRVFGRVIGLVFLLPFLFFVIRGYVKGRQIAGLLILFIVGGLQGLLGWYMVKSGLVDNPQVSQYRLTAHLSLAVVLYGALVWSGLSFAGRRYSNSKAPLAVGAGFIGVLLISAIGLMIVSGGFMAGTHAGRVYNTFPLIDGSLWPANMWQMQPGWRNLFENVITIQVMHRSFAVLSLLITLLMWWRCRNSDAATLSRVLLVAVLAQAGLGVATLLYKVPVPLAAIHQAGAVVVLSFSLLLVHRIINSRP